MTSEEIALIVEKALNIALQEIEDYEEGDILVEWVVVTYVTNPDSEKTTGYPILMSSDEMPRHHLRGLLEMGMHRLNTISFSPPEDDEE